MIRLPPPDSPLVTLPLCRSPKAENKHEGGCFDLTDNDRTGRSTVTRTPTADCAGYRIGLSIEALESEIVTLNQSRNEKFDELYKSYGGGSAATGVAGAVKEAHGTNPMNNFTKMFTGAVASVDKDMLQLRCQQLGSGEAASAGIDPALTEFMAGRPPGRSVRTRRAAIAEQESELGAGCPLAPVAQLNLALPWTADRRQGPESMHLLIAHLRRLPLHRHADHGPGFLGPRRGLVLPDVWRGGGHLEQGQPPHVLHPRSRPGSWSPQLQHSADSAWAQPQVGRLGTPVGGLLHRVLIHRGWYPWLYPVEPCTAGHRSSSEQSPPLPVA